MAAEVTLQRAAAEAVTKQIPPGANLWPMLWGSSAQLLSRLVGRSLRGAFGPRRRSSL